MTPEEVEAELRHVATKEDVALLKSDLQRELAVNTRWLVGIMVGLQVPTWIGIIQLWMFLANIANRLPK